MIFSFTLNKNPSKKLRFSFQCTADLKFIQTKARDLLNRRKYQGLSFFFLIVSWLLVLRNLSTSTEKSTKTAVISQNRLWSDFVDILGYVSTIAGGYHNPFLSLALFFEFIVFSLLRQRLNLQLSTDKNHINQINGNI